MEITEALMAEIGVQALIKAGSPGYAFLYLCDAITGGSDV
jgi:hypothetical protein